MDGKKEVTTLIINSGDERATHFTPSSNLVPVQFEHGATPANTLAIMTVQKRRASEHKQEESQQGRRRKR